MIRLGCRLRVMLESIGVGGAARARAIDPLDRRESGGQLRGFAPEFFPAREEALRPVMGMIETAGALHFDMLQREALANFDERVVEYPVALDALLQLREQGRLLDVGCVLNNRVIKEQVKQYAGKVWLWNASLERPVYNEDLAYVICDLRRPFLPEVVNFDLVTCFSTLEHTGLDNTRYGGKAAEFEGEIADPERFAAAGLRNIMRYVAPGGRLLVSVPFGPFEYLYVHGAPDRPIYYTFDRVRLETLAQALGGFDVRLSAYRVVPGQGWFPADLNEDKEMLRHADGCASAGGVAFIDAIRSQ